MNKIILIAFLLLAGCNLEPSQFQIDEAARIQNRNKEKCETIGKSMGALTEFRKENGDWLCLVYKKTYLNNPWAVFYESDLSSINRYLYVLERK